MKQKVKTSLDRPARLVRALATSKTTTSALEKAGYSKNTAKAQQKRTIETALEIVSNRALKGDKTAQRMLENVGTTMEQVKEAWNYLAYRSQNDNVRLQTLTPVFEAVLGIQYKQKDEQKAPAVINIVFSQPTAQPQRIYDIEPPTQEAQ